MWAKVKSEVVQYNEAVKIVDFERCMNKQSCKRRQGFLAGCQTTTER
jgi:hypothetical protein